MRSIVLAAAALTAAGSAGAQSVPAGPNAFWEANEPYVGAFESAEGSRIVVGMFPGDEVLFASWPATGELRMLAETNEDSFTFGPARSVTQPAVGRIVFERDGGGDVDAIAVERGGSWDRAERIAYGRRDVRFENGAEATLAGEIWTPAGDGPFPAAVVVAQADRFDTFETGMSLLDAGVAVLLFDRRNADPGRSSGEPARGYYHETQRVHARDAAAAATFLRAQPDVDPEQVGLIGWSGGGHIAALVAGAQPETAFLVNIAGNVSPGVEQSSWRGYARLFREGYSDEEIAEAKSFLDLHSAVARRESDWVGYAAERARMESAGWYQFLTSWMNMTYADEEDAHAWGDSVSAADPFADFAKVRAPALGLFFEHDHSSPPTTPLRFHEALTAAGNSDFAVAVVPDANHGAWEVDGLRFNTQEITRRKPETFAILRAWVAQHVTTPSR